MEIEMNRKTFTFAILSLLVGFGVVANAQDLTGIKCLVTGEQGAKAENAVDYLDGKVYLCCPRCKEKFSGNVEDFSTKANHQLVVTGQYVQTSCPSGHKIDGQQHKLNLAGVEVHFCSAAEMKKVTEATSVGEKVNLVFSNAAFRKTFGKKKSADVTNAKCIFMPKLGVSEKHAVDFQQGKLFFCCESCIKKFESKKDDPKIVARANEQLYATGQYRQKTCPIGGHALSDDNSVEINGSKIRVCCSSCVGALNELESDEARLVKIFNKDNFAKSFEPAK